MAKIIVTTDDGRVVDLIETAKQGDLRDDFFRQIFVEKIMASVNMADMTESLELLPSHAP